jgi:hypothetical protein
MHSYDPAELMAKLSGMTLPDPTELTIVGLAKSEEESRSLFTSRLRLHASSGWQFPLESLTQ